MWFDNRVGIQDSGGELAESAILNQLIRASSPLTHGSREKNRNKPVTSVWTFPLTQALILCLLYLIVYICIVYILSTVITLWWKHCVPTWYETRLYFILICSGGQWPFPTQPVTLFCWVCSVLFSSAVFVVELKCVKSTRRVA